MESVGYLETKSREDELKSTDGDGRGGVGVGERRGKERNVSCIWIYFYVTHDRI